MKNYQKAQFLIEQLESDGFKMGNAFFHRLEVALDKLDAIQQSAHPTAESVCVHGYHENKCIHKTCIDSPKFGWGK